MQVRNRFGEKVAKLYWLNLDECWKKAGLENLRVCTQYCNFLHLIFSISVSSEIERGWLQVNQPQETAPSVVKTRNIKRHSSGTAMFSEIKILTYVTYYLPIVCMILSEKSSYV